MENEQELRWLEAAYVYYLHPEHGELMSDFEWDHIGRELGKPGSLYWMREQDYPESVRSKYSKRN